MVIPEREEGQARVLSGIALALTGRAGHGSIPMIVCDQIEYDGINQAVWQRLSDAADDQTHPMRLLTVATMDEHGWPDARILVLRGVDAKFPCLWFYTDARSAKAAQLDANGQRWEVVHHKKQNFQFPQTNKNGVVSGMQIKKPHWVDSSFPIQK